MRMLGETRYVGSSVLRNEDQRLLNGNGNFLDDIKISGCQYIHFVRSNIAHGIVKSIDISEAEKIIGITKIYTGEDLQGMLQSMAPSKADGGIFEEKLFSTMGNKDAFIRREDRHPIVVGKVRHVGEIIAVVVGTDPYVIEDAAELIIVDIEEIQPVVDPKDALEVESPKIYDHWEDNRSLYLHVSKGDIEDAFANAHTTVKRTFYSGRISASPIETRGVIAHFEDHNEKLTVWSSTQIPHPVRTYLAHSLNLPSSRIRVVAPDVGGGFGCKAIPYPEEILCSLISIQLKIPVRWIEDRLEHFTSSIHSRDQFHDIEIAMDAEGKILGLRDDFLMDCGASNPLGVVQPYNTIAHLSGCYEVPAMDVTATAVVTNKVPLSPYRGAGRPEAVFAMDRILDVAAQEMGLDPFDVRRKNLVPAESMPYSVGINYRDGAPIVYDSGDFPKCFDTAVELLQSSCDADRSRDESGRYIGLGAATYVEGTGIGPFEGALVRVDETGNIHVAIGACPQGQGHETVFAQIAADTLAVDIKDVKVVTGDTDAIPYGWGTLASRSAVVAGSAVYEAATKVLQKVKIAVADEWEINPDDLIAQQGRIFVKGTPTKETTLEEVAEKFSPGGDYAQKFTPGLEEQIYWEPPTVTFASGVHIARVAVDADTGTVEILTYIVVHDCGPLLNPQIVDGQIAGGVAQGIGAALFEEICYDDNGQPLNPNLMDYILPTNDTIPDLLIEHLETPSPLNPLGIKGVGEAGTIPPPAAIANAIENALTEIGVEINKVPVSPKYLLNQIQKTKEAKL